MSPNTKRLTRLDVHYLTYHPYLLPQIYLRRLHRSWRYPLLSLSYTDIVAPGFLFASIEAERPLLEDCTVSICQP